MSFTRRARPWVLCLAALSLFVADARADVATFADTGKINGVGQHNNDTAPGFASGGQFFNNSYDTTYGSWSGWSVSSATDTTTPGYLNQYSAITGSGQGDAYYGVATSFTPNDAYINLTGAPVSVSYTNTTYAYLSMIDGDSFAKKFAAGDYFTFHLDGYTGANGTGADLGFVTGTLANYTSDASTPLSTWATLDLTSLKGAKSLSLSFQSSDVGPFGINTPTYAAFDNLVVGTAAVPEPSPLVLAVVGVTAAGALGRFGRSRTSARLGDRS